MLYKIKRIEDHHKEIPVIFLHYVLSQRIFYVSKYMRGIDKIRINPRRIKTGYHHSLDLFLRVCHGNVQDNHLFPMLAQELPERVSSPHPAVGIKEFIAAWLMNYKVINTVFTRILARNEGRPGRRAQWMECGF